MGADRSPVRRYNPGDDPAPAIRAFALIGFADVAEHCRSHNPCCAIYCQFCDMISNNALKAYCDFPSPGIRWRGVLTCAGARDEEPIQRV